MGVQHNMNSRQVAAVLVGLRLLQKNSYRLKLELEEIATNGGEFQALDENEIDQLCQEVNFGHVEDFELARRVYAHTFDSCESFDDNHIGLELAYLLGAILSGSKFEPSARKRGVQDLMTILMSFPERASLDKYLTTS